MKKIIKYVIIDILRNKTMLIFTGVLLLLSFSIFNLEDNSSKGILSLLNIVLIVVPMVSMLFSCIYLYNSAEFIELLVSQPLQRKTIWLSLFSGLSLSFVACLLLALGLPILLYEATIVGVMLLLSAIVLAIIFVALSSLIVVKIRDKAKGIGMAIVIWLYFALIFDGFVLFILFQFADYPLEKVMITFSIFNPIDLSRIMMLLQMDVSALMGFTGAVFKEFYGTAIGMSVTAITMLLWIVFPYLISRYWFNRKDL